MNLLFDWASRGLLPITQVRTLGAELGLLPNRAAWRHWLDRVLLLAGALLLATGLIFFIAANWGELGRFGKFVLAQVAVLAGVALYWRYGDHAVGRAGLGFSVLAIGALFALYGQTYQTGADPWQLFATWAVCALPLVWLARAAPLWLGWLVLVDLGLLRWLSFQVGRWGWFSEGEWLCWALVISHGLALVLAETRANRTPRYARQILYVATLWPLATLAFMAIFDDWLEVPALAALVWLAAAAATLVWYRGRRFDLIPLAAMALSAIVLGTSLLAHALDDYDNPGIWLLLALCCMGMTGGAGAWLLKQARTHRQVTT